MNYSTFRMQQLLYTEFIENFTREHGIKDWAAIQRNLDEATRKIFEAAVARNDGLASGTTGQRFISAAIYGTDVMLDAEFNPIVLEVNFSPDCTRACNYDPNFFNDIFSVLFT